MSYRFRRNGRLWVPEAGRYGIGGGSLSWDGIDDEVSRAAVTIGQAFSAAAWIKPVTIGEGSLGRIYHHGPTSSFRTHLLLQTTSKLRFTAFWSLTDGQWTTTNNVITLGAWQHVLVTYSSSSSSNNPVIYLNGVAQAITEDVSPSGSIGSDGGTLYVGNRGDGTRTFDGLIGQFAIIARILTADEATALHLLGPLAVAGGSEMILWWDMEGSDANARDLSGNGRDGTVTGPTLAEHYPASSFSADAVQVVMR